MVDLRDLFGAVGIVLDGGWVEFWYGCEAREVILYLRL